MAPERDWPDGPCGGETAEKIGGLDGQGLSPRRGPSSPGRAVRPLVREPFTGGCLSLWISRGSSNGLEGRGLDVPTSGRLTKGPVEERALLRRRKVDETLRIPGF